MSSNSNMSSASSNSTSSSYVFRAPGSADFTSFTNVLPPAGVGQIRQIQPQPSRATGSQIPLPPQPQAGNGNFGSRVVRKRGPSNVEATIQTVRISNPNTVSSTSGGSVTTTTETGGSAVITTTTSRLESTEKKVINVANQRGHHFTFSQTPGNIQEIVPGGRGRGGSLQFGGKKPGPVYRMPSE